MLRRALVFTLIGVALSAAGAFAFAPGLARVGHRFGLRTFWPARAFTADPRVHDFLTQQGDSLAQDVGGVPGTYCPIRPRDAHAPAASLDQASANVTALDSGSTPAHTSSNDLLQPAPAANCTVPPAPTPVARPVLP